MTHQSSPHHPLRRRIPREFALALLAGALLLCSCQRGITPRVAAPRYPEAAPRAGVLDIQARRSSTDLRITNSTSTPLDAGRLWLNMRFSHTVPTLAPGASLTLDLRDFRDDLGDAFRGGGFFAAEKPDPVVLAEWQEGALSGRLLGLRAIVPEATLGTTGLGTQ